MHIVKRGAQPQLMGTLRMAVGEQAEGLHDSCVACVQRRGHESFARGFVAINGLGPPALLE